jgi:SAM-dependent methyltransferase
MLTAVFDAYSRYYDLLYRDKDYAGEAAYIQGLLTRFGITQGELLEFGSGTGRHGRLLAEMGYRVHGIERSAEMVTRAKASEGFSCQQGDICTIQMGRTYDAVLSLFHVVSYQASNAELLAVFARAGEHLQPGGVFVFDFWYSPAVYTQQPTVRVKRMADAHVEITRIAEPSLHPNENCVNVTYTIYARDVACGAVQTLKETHIMRHFSLPELDLVARLSDFERVGAEEFVTSKPPGADTWGVCAVFKRIGI